jgi:hypothetical protein
MGVLLVGSCPRFFKAECFVMNRCLVFDFTGHRGLSRFHPRVRQTQRTSIKPFAFLLFMFIWFHVYLSIQKYNRVKTSLSSLSFNPRKGRLVYYLLLYPLLFELFITLQCTPHSPNLLLNIKHKPKGPQICSL